MNPLNIVEFKHFVKVLASCQTSHQNELTINWIHNILHRKYQFTNRHVDFKYVMNDIWDMVDRIRTK